MSAKRFINEIAYALFTELETGKEVLEYTVKNKDKKVVGYAVAEISKEEGYFDQVKINEVYLISDSTSDTMPRISEALEAQFLGYVEEYNKTLRNDFLETATPSIRRNWELEMRLNG